MRLVLHSLLALSFGSAASAGGLVLHVDAAAPPGGDGSSFASAFIDLQDALDAARIQPGVSAIHVAEGLYLPDRGTGDPLLSFELVDGVEVLGGFPSGGGARDPRAHPSRLSGDLSGDDGVPSPNYIVPGRGDNARHVVRATGLGPGTLLDGFFITAGQADVSGLGEGGGARVEGGAPTLRGCTFDLNGTEWMGGGLYLEDSGALVESCVFTRNRAARSGGGVQVSGPVAATFRACRFEDNVGGVGAGLAIGVGPPLAGSGSATRVEGSLFLANRAVVGATAGGGLYAALSTPRILDCRFDGNFANGGGGVFLEASQGWLERCDFIGNDVNGDGGGALSVVDFSSSGLPATEVISCAMHGNNGGILALGSHARVVNVTLAENRIPGGSLGGDWPAVAAFGSTVELLNSIVWGNVPGGGDGDERDHLIGTAFGTTTYVVDHSIVEGWAAVLGGVGSGSDPLFLSPAGADGDPMTLEDNDLRLRRASPALDAGDRGHLPLGAAGDLLGEPRVRDGDGDGLRQIDLGAWERPRWQAAPRIGHP